MNAIITKAQTWLTDFFDADTQKQVQNLIDNSPKALEECFHKNLEFGTGGMRGIMGVGTNRINKYTLGKNTQGLSNYLKKTITEQPIKVVIAYDCRHHSDTLAQTVAEVFSANGIQVFLFSALRTTPELSFAVRYLQCHAGIVLTASHNPPEYNGYKVYGADGGQITPPQDSNIIAEIDALAFEDVNFKADPSLIQKIDQEVDKAFIQNALKHGSFDAQDKENLKIVFTPLHGTSITAIPEVLNRAGYSQVTIIAAQSQPNGDFPTVVSPNPEEPEALSLALQKAAEIGGDIVIGTDPDSDRLGIAVRNLEGNLELLNGNQTMIVMTRFLLNHYQRKKFRGNEFIATTVVSTPMMAQLAQAYGVELKTSLTGFKWIGKMVRDFPKNQFIGGGEESYGYMVGDFVRDKDAVTATLLACEIASIAKAKGSSFYQELVDCYIRYGFYKEQLISITKKGIQGAEEIARMLNNFKTCPPQTLHGSKVIRIEDYSSSTARNLQTGEEYPLHLPKSSLLIYKSEDGTQIAVRPSGTEPKIKFYLSVRTTLEKSEDYKSVNSRLEAKIKSILAELNLL